LLALALSLVPLAARSADPYPIYVLLPLSGSGSFYAASQQQSLRAIEQDVNRHGGIQGRQITFVIQDDQSNPQVDVALAGQIFAKHVPILLGPTLTAQCNAIIPMALKDGPATWCFTPGAHPSAGSYIFGFGADTSHVIDVSLRYLAARGIKRIATISSTDASGQDGDRNIEAAAAKEKITLIEREHFNPTDVSVSAQIARIKAASPQALVVWTTGTPFGTVLRSIRDVGLDVPVLSTNGNITRAQMKQYGPLLPKDLMFPGAAFLDPDQITDKGVKAVVKTFYDGVHAQGGANPDWGNNNCYDGARLFVEALKKYGLNATPQQVRDYIHSLRNWPGVNGRYDFTAEPQRGLGDDSIVMVRWDGGKDNWVAISKPGGAL
jgi:branched-chain amino acid transport system substrate-binding protein